MKKVTYYIAGGVAGLVALYYALRPKVAAGAETMPTPTPAPSGRFRGDASDFGGDKTRFVKGLLPLLMENGWSYRSALLFITQAGYETGWGKSFRAPYNLTNLTRRPGDTQIPAVKGNDTDYNPATGKSDRIEQWFRSYTSYPDFFEGFKAFMLSIKNGSKLRYANTSYPLLMRGDPQYFTQLGIDGYYGSNNPKDPSFATSVANRVNTFNQLVKAYESYNV